MTVQERLRKFIESVGLNDAQFQKHCGLGNGYINNISQSIGKKSLEKIENKYPDLNKAWLLLGEGNMLISETKTNNSDPPKDLLEEIEKLKEEINEQKKQIRTLIRACDNWEEKYDELEKRYKSLKPEPLKKAGGLK